MMKYAVPLASRVRSSYHPSKSHLKELHTSTMNLTSFTRTIDDFWCLEITINWVDSIGRFQSLSNVIQSLRYSSCGKIKESVLVANSSMTLTLLFHVDSLPRASSMILTNFINKIKMADAKRLILIKMELLGRQMSNRDSRMWFLRMVEIGGTSSGTIWQMNTL